MFNQIQFCNLLFFNVSQSSLIVETTAYSFAKPENETYLNVSQREFCILCFVILFSANRGKG